MDFITKIKTIIMKPKDFFTKVKKEKDFITPWKYYMLILGIGYIVSFIAQIPGIMFSKTLGGMFGSPMSNLGIFVQLGITLGILIMLYILMAGLVFLFFGIIHLFYLIVGAKKGYVQTFKIMSYTSTIFLLSIPLTLIGSIPILGIFLNILTIPIALVIFGYAIYVQIQGGMILHELSSTRAIIAALLPFIIGIIFAIVIFAILLIVGIGFLSQMPEMNAISGMVTGFIG